MLTNLLSPLVLARLLAGLGTAALCSYALVRVAPARRALRRIDPAAGGMAGEALLLAERRAELASAVVQAALAFGVLSLFLTVLAADALAPALRGAMCAWGVFESGAGFGALGSSALLSLAAGSWLALHRYDLDLRAAELTPVKLGALLPLTALAWLDLALNATFFYGLDLGATASCCSAGLDELKVEWMPGSTALTRAPAALVASGLLALAIALLVRAAKHPNRRRARTAAVWGLLSIAATWPATLWYVAPHAFETPHHNCPFCLLHGDVLGLGYALFGGLLWAAVDSLGLLVVQHLPSAREPEVTAAHLGSLSKHAAMALGVAWLAGALPVVRYALLTQGASLF